MEAKLQKMLATRAKRKQELVKVEEEKKKVLADIRRPKTQVERNKAYRMRKRAGLESAELMGKQLADATTAKRKRLRSPDTTLMGYDRVIDHLPPDPWKLLPHTFASVLSDGAWIAYRYLILISHVISLAIARGGGRILVSLPPRHGKSWFISQWVPAWFLANWPHKRVILTTYEPTFAATWGRKVRNIIKEHGSRIGVSLADDSTAANNWSTDKEGGMMTAGVGGPITGKGMDLGIIDDPHKNWQEAQSQSTRKGIQEWFDSTFYTRAEPGATIIVLATRWNEDDLIGYLTTERAADGWFHIVMPAIAEENDILGRLEGEALCPERYDIDALVRIKANMTAMMWAALFQQRPAPAEGTIFLRERWKFYDRKPVFSFVLQSWDTATKKNYDAAFSVCQTWGISPFGVYLIDQFRERVQYPQLRKAVDMQYYKYRPNVILIEDRDSGQALIQSLQQETSYPVIPVYPDMDKLIRAQAVSPWQVSERLWLPTPSQASWIGDFVESCAAFPNTKFMDEVDAMSQAIAYVMTMAIGGRVHGDRKRVTSKLLEGFREMM